MTRYYIKRPDSPWILCGYESYMLMAACMMKLGDGYGVGYGVAGESI